MKTDALTNTLQEYLAVQSEVLVAYLFGSSARRQARQSSDLDVGMLLASELGAEERLLARIRMASDLEKLVACRVDVVDLGLTPPHFNHQVLREGVILKGKAEPLRIDFEKRVRREYFDMLRFRQRYINESLQQMREGGPSDVAGGTDSRALEAARRLYERLGRSDRS